MKKGIDSLLWHGGLWKKSTTLSKNYKVVNNRKKLEENFGL